MIRPPRGCLPAFPLALVLALVPAGCGDDDGRAGGCNDCGPYGEVLGAICDYFERCPDALYPITYRDREECIDILYFLFTCRLNDIEINDEDTFTLEEHVPTVSQADADACEAFFAAASCDLLEGGGTPPPGGEACLGLLAQFEDDGGGGSKPAGETCSYSSDCQDDLWCPPERVDPAMGLRTCRVCDPLPAEGEPCGSDSPQCVEGLYCSYQSGMALCAPLSANGDDCMSPSECATGFCNPRTMRCDPGGEDGDPCTESGDCRDGYCDAAGACADRLEHGVACASDDACQNGDCHDATGVCGLPDGSPCSPSSDARCASGHCHDAMATCQPQLADGQPCLNHAECQSEYCDYSTMRCIAHCYSDDDCPAEQYCHWSSSTCAPRGDVGAACQGDEECLAGYCNFDDQCAIKPGIGDPCTSSPDCYPYGFCSGNVCVKKLGPDAACTALDSCGEPYLCTGGRCELISLECRPGAPGEKCAFLRVCDDTAYCDFYGGFMCVARHGEGGSCTSNEECLKTLRCEPSPTGEGSCVARGGEGDACTAPDECGPDLYCIFDTSTSGTCGAGPEGRPCDEYDAPCPTGLFCEDDTRTCQPPHDLGEDCYYMEPCVEGLYCDISLGCQPRAGQGADCDYDTPCQEPYYCDDTTSPRTCQPDVQLGEHCTESSSFPIECAAGLYCVWNGSDTVCTAQKAQAEDCSEDVECLSGACDDGYGCLAAAECFLP